VAVKTGKACLFKNHPLRCATLISIQNKQHLPLKLKEPAALQTSNILLLLAPKHIIDLDSSIQISGDRHLESQIDSHLNQQLAITDAENYHHHHPKHAITVLE
jgi:hypothetical protein